MLRRVVGTNILRRLYHWKQAETEKGDHLTKYQRWHLELIAISTIITYFSVILAYHDYATRARDEQIKSTLEIVNKVSDQEFLNAYVRLINISDLARDAISRSKELSFEIIMRIYPQATREHWELLVLYDLNMVISRYTSIGFLLENGLIQSELIPIADSRVSGDFCMFYRQLHVITRYMPGWSENPQLKFLALRYKCNGPLKKPDAKTGGSQ